MLKVRSPRPIARCCGEANRTVMFAGTAAFGFRFMRALVKWQLRNERR